MHRATVPLVEFYQNMLPAAAAAGYKIVLTALAREADTTVFYEDVKRDWSSLHDVTGPDILFVFAGTNAATILRDPNPPNGAGIRDSQDPVCYMSNDIAFAAGAKTLYLQSHHQVAFSTVQFDEHPHHSPLVDGTLARDHTLEIRALRCYFGVTEAELPSFVLTLLDVPEYTRVVLPLDALKNRTIYAFLKMLVGACEGFFRQIDSHRANRRTLSRVLAEERKVLEKERQTLSREERPLRELQGLRFSVEKASQDLSASNAKEAVVEILTACAKSGRSNDERAKCFQCLQVVRKEHPRQTGIIPDIQSLIDRSFLPSALNSSGSIDHERRVLNISSLETRRSQLLAHQDQNLKSEDETWSKLHASVKECTQRSTESIDSPLVSTSNPLGSAGNRQRGNHMTKILFLAANPAGTGQLALTEEVQKIKQHLRSSDHGRQFQVEQEWAVKLSELNAAFLRHQPDIVHFSGHGSSAGELVLETESGTPTTVNPKALTNLFKILKRNIRCVVLNACFSASQAEAIAQHIDCVVGMTTAVGDKGAIEFAWAFYEALGFNASVHDAFELGRNQVDFSRLPDKDVPKLISRSGVKPEEIYFLDPR